LNGEIDSKKGGRKSWGGGTGGPDAQWKGQDLGKRRGVKRGALPQQGSQKIKLGEGGLSKTGYGQRDGKTYRVVNNC